MRILVIGAGAIGGVTAGLLVKHGLDVEIACKTQKQADQINTYGLTYKVKNRKYTHVIAAYTGVQNTPGNYDYVLLATKSFEIEQPVREVLDKILPTGLIISFQDGYCEKRIARFAGSNQVVGAVISWGASVNENGIPIMTAGGEMIIGKLDGSDDPRLDNLSYILSSIVPTYAVDNINEHIFSKLIINSAVTALGAISGEKTGILASNKKVRNIFIRLIQEAITIANKINIEIPDFAGKIDYYQLAKDSTWFYKFRSHIHIILIGIKYRKIKSAGLHALERGEKTEVDFLNGYFFQKGKELGIELPINEQLTTMIHEIEEGKRNISPENFNNLSY